MQLPEHFQPHNRITNGDQAPVNAERRTIYVTADEFGKLAISNRTMIRANKTAIRLRGLLDTNTGEHFVIEEEELFRN